jgi:hypothetical protein
LKQGEKWLNFYKTLPQAENIAAAKAPRKYKVKINKTGYYLFQGLHTEVGFAQNLNKSRGHICQKK